MQLPSGTLLNEDATPPIRMVKADPQKVSFAKPRLCVALDYLWVMWKTTGAAENPIFFINPDQRALKPATNKIPAYFEVRLGAKIRALDCISEINFYAYVKTRNSDEFKKISTKYEVAPSGGYFSHRIRFDNQSSIEILNSLIANFSGLTPPVIFCEVTLRNPTGASVQHYNWDDKWYFPIKLEKMSSTWWTLSRENGEAGEVPNWPWLNKAFPKKYPNSKLVKL